MVNVPRSALALAALATSAVPGLEPVATVEPQRVGADVQMTGVMDAAGRRWVVRCALHQAACAQLLAESALLGPLWAAVDEGLLPFEVPRAAGHLDLSDGEHVVVTRAVRGTPLDLGKLRPGPGLAANLGAAIAAIHELPASLVADVGLPVYTADSYRRRCLAEVDEAARTGRVPSVLLDRWERALEAVALWRFRATPVHADLAADQVYVHDGRVTGVVGFTEAHVGDPAEDLAWLMAAAPEDALDAIVEAYVMGRTEHADSALLDRAMLTSELALARWLLHGVRSGDESIVADAVTMLDELAEDVAEAPPIGYHEPVTTDGTWEVVSTAAAPPARDGASSTPEGGPPAPEAEARRGFDTHEVVDGAREPSETVEHAEHARVPGAAGRRSAGRAPEYQHGGPAGSSRVTLTDVLDLDVAGHGARRGT